MASTATAPDRREFVSLPVKQGNAAKRQRKERIVAVILTALMVVASIPLILILFQVIQRGWAAVMQPPLPAPTSWWCGPRRLLLVD
jgi:ABC-type phosphate transport system permease subunit